jgi:hypothetical protein
MQSAVFGNTICLVVVLVGRWANVFGGSADTAFGTAFWLAYVLYIDGCYFAAKLDIAEVKTFGD